MSSPTLRFGPRQGRPCFGGWGGEFWRPTLIGPIAVAGSEGPGVGAEALRCLVGPEAGARLQGQALGQEPGTRGGRA